MKAIARTVSVTNATSTLLTITVNSKARYAYYEAWQINNVASSSGTQVYRNGVKKGLKSANAVAAIGESTPVLSGYAGPGDIVGVGGDLINKTLYITLVEYF